MSNMNMIKNSVEMFSAMSDEQKKTMAKKLDELRIENSYKDTAIGWQCFIDAMEGLCENSEQQETLLVSVLCKFAGDKQTQE